MSPSPLGLRHGVWLIALFLVLFALVRVRLETQALRQQLARSASLIDEAEALRDRLRLETAARRRAAVMERSADRLGLTPAEIRVLRQGAP